MDLRALEVFCKIVELRSFSRAAEAVLLTQPTVSGHIKALEEELDLRLFDRAGRNVTPTRAGELLHGYARRIMALREEAQQAISEHRGGLKGHLAIGGSSIPGAYILPPLLATFKRDHPEVTIGLHISGSRDIVRGVIEGATELGMVGARFEEGRVQYEPFAQDELVLAVAVSHPWARRSTVRLMDLLGQPFVMRERGSGTRKVMEEALARRDLDPGRLRVVLEVTGNEAVRQAVKAGAGVAVISRRAIEDDIRCKLVAALRVQGMKLVRDFFLVTHKSRSRSPLGKTFLAFLQKTAPSSH
ncbi:MAG TPA: selenium metabolism-associated LysR family transcriptional regulator [Candidatus Methylomirabilis sp.]|nr:selenium metabolism-associated LysR family transcriptional regulator [Candidatus Methylomirabilis sp.]